MKKCVFAGSFDPFTVGHADVVQKSLRIFDEVIIAVGRNTAKRCMFSAEERLEMVSSVYANEPRVKIVLWEGVIVDLLQREGTPFYVRGIRSGRDFEYEQFDAYASHDLDPDMLTVFLPCEQQHLHLSSSLVRNCIAFHKSFESYVPQEVFAYIERKGCLQKN